MSVERRELHKTPRQDMPRLEPQERVKSFDQIALGFDEETAVLEASRCLNCPKPACRQGCPIQNEIPDFIMAIKEREFAKAAGILRHRNQLSAVCGRVCPQESLCEGSCVIGKKHEPVAIGSLERFAADWELKNGFIMPEIPEANGKKVAVVGAGPAGIACAADLAKLGYQVTIFESQAKPGGVLTYGIPQFRLPKDIINKEFEFLRKLGIELKTGVTIGKDQNVDALLANGYDAVFLGTGAPEGYSMGIPGEDLKGVYISGDYLAAATLEKIFGETYRMPVKTGKRLAVLGGGNTAMDVATVALRMGAEEVMVVYRRSEQEMPARHEDIELAKEEGVIFHLLTNPVEIIGDENGNVVGMKCLRYELGEPDESGRRKPVPIEGSEFVMDVDTVVLAIGQGPDPLIAETTQGLETTKWGTFVTTDKGQTTKIGVYAGGDVVTGASLVVKAIRGGRNAAEAIHEHLQNR